MRRIREDVELGKPVEEELMDKESLTPYKAIKYLCSRSENSGLSKEFWTSENVCTCLAVVRKVLPLNDNQIILFAVISAYTIGRDSVMLQELGSKMGISPFSLFEMQNDIDDMLCHRILQYKRCGYGSDVGYCVNLKILENLRDNKKAVMPEPLKIEDNLDFINYMAYNLSKKSTHKVMEVISNGICEKNKRITVLQRMKDKGLKYEERCMLFILLNMCIRSAGAARFSNIDDILSNNEEELSMFDTRKYFMDEDAPLMKMKYTEIAPGNFGNDNMVAVTKKCISELLPEDEKKIMREPKKEENINGCTIIKPRDIMEKPLIYDDKTSMQVQMLSDILSERGLNNIQTNLKKQGLRSGINVLLFGYPGTGKTETVLQLCKQSGREVMQVNISDMKSSWFGQSEKIINGLFETYEDIVKRRHKTPVLLFNEADALLSRRKQIRDTDGCAQTENAIQNIILQHFENSRGIIICTTNMIKNLDDAFSRRFLYKIEFSKPDRETKAALVKLKLGQYLTENECLALASNYQITGGMLDNILTKVVAKKCLYEGAITSNDIYEYCRQDEMAEREPIKGFMANN
ncbi:MAG: ATP-binding protein [Prevotella sp.]|jgi:hypothetical protein|nr:ATP-binding protein [Prevotella sp.]MCI1281856.1 ATP-binding protein [Prevotella sp.]